MTVGRKAVGVLLPFHAKHYGPYYCDPNESRGKEVGLKHRLGVNPPVVSGQMLMLLRRISMFLLQKVTFNLPQPTQFDWLEQTSYSHQRKIELVRNLERSYRYDAARVRGDRVFPVRTFVKREDYMIPKAPRLINSRSDAFKMLTGPFFHWVEQCLKNQPWFIKGNKVCDYPNVLRRRFGNSGPLMSTDHSHFEAQMVARVQKVCEAVLYKEALRHWKCGAQRLERLIWTNIFSAGKCATFNRDLVFSVEGRMSGDMCTSLGNGWTNLVTLLAANVLSNGYHYHIGRDPDHVVDACIEHAYNLMIMVVEGDDGVFYTKGVFPLPEHFAKVGMVVKHKMSASIGEAGFCHHYFRDGGSVLDPVRYLNRLGVTTAPQRNGSRDVLLGLLRAKALSLYYSSPNSPVTSYLAKWLIDETTKYKPIYDEHNRWYDECIGKQGVVVNPVATYGDRMLCERIHGIGIGRQLQLEAMFHGPIRPIDFGEITPVINRVLFESVAVGRQYC